MDEARLLAECASVKTAYFLWERRMALILSPNTTVKAVEADGVKAAAELAASQLPIGEALLERAARLRALLASYDGAGGTPTSQPNGIQSGLPSDAEMVTVIGHMRLMVERLALAALTADPDVWSASPPPAPPPTAAPPQRRAVDRAVAKRWIDAAKAGDVAALASLFDLHAGERDDDDDEAASSRASSLKASSPSPSSSSPSPSPLAAASLPGVGHTALHWACAKGETAAAEWLMRRARCDANARNAEGATPAHAAAANGKAACALALARGGADLLARADDGESVADAAKARGHLALAKALAVAETRLRAARGAGGLGGGKLPAGGSADSAGDLCAAAPLPGASSVAAVTKDAWNRCSKNGDLTWKTSRWRCAPRDSASAFVAPAPPARRRGRSSRVSFRRRSTRMVRPASRNTVAGATAHRSGDPARTVSSSAFRL